MFITLDQIVNRILKSEKRRRDPTNFRVIWSSNIGFHNVDCIWRLKKKSENLGVTMGIICDAIEEQKRRCSTSSNR